MNNEQGVEFNFNPFMVVYDPCEGVNQEYLNYEPVEAVPKPEQKTEAIVKKESCEEIVEVVQEKEIID